MDIEKDIIKALDSAIHSSTYKGPMMEFQKLDEFVRAIKECKPEILYKWSVGQTSQRGFFYKGILHIFALPNVFPSIEEYLEAKKEGFTCNYQKWKEIKELGYKNAEEFDTARGSYDLDQWIVIKKLGYKNAEEFDTEKGSYNINDWIMVKGLGYKNAKEFDEVRGNFNYQQWIKIRKIGFKTSDDFEDAVRIGFVPRNVYNYNVNQLVPYKDAYEEYCNAKKGGFANKSRYEQAKGMGFDRRDEWLEFRGSGFQSKDEFLKSKKYGITNRDTLVVYDFLKRLDLGEQVALSKIAKKTGIPQEELERVLKEPAIARLGVYNENIEIFSRQKGDEKPSFKIDSSSFAFKTAVVDGNNVAYHLGKENLNLDFLINTKKKLEGLGLKVYPFVSAALRHYIDDKEKLQNLINSGEVIETPAERYDDFFIIQTALEKKAFIVSNDRFKDWKERNPDKADAIDERRVGYTFVDSDPQFDHKLSTLIKKPLK